MGEIGAIAKAIAARWNLSAPLCNPLSNVAPQDPPPVHVRLFFVGGYPDSVLVQFAIFFRTAKKGEVWSLYEALKKLFHRCEMEVEGTGSVVMRIESVPVLDPETVNKPFVDKKYGSWWYLHVNFRMEWLRESKMASPYGFTAKELETAEGALRNLLDVLGEEESRDLWAERERERLKRQIDRNQRHLEHLLKHAKLPEIEELKRRIEHFDFWIDEDGHPCVGEKNV